jgi:hypothetical protein
MLTSHRYQPAGLFLFANVFLNLIDELGIVFLFFF